jgi:hypothetical protein
LLANDVAVTSSGIVGIKWSAVNYDGGSPVIDYKISWTIKGVAYSVLPNETGVKTLSYKATGLTPNVVYSFKVAARNLNDFGDDSSAVDIRAAGGPSAPATPETSVNTNISVTITWDAPYNNGSPITGYTVAIRQNDAVTYTAESINCNGLSTKCTVPISVLLAPPYYLPWGASIYAVVLA